MQKLLPLFLVYFILFFFSIQLSPKFKSNHIP